MKIRKENLWNRIFHRKQLKEQRQEQIRLWYVIDKATGAIAKLEKASSLRELLDIHKEMWKNGLRDKSISPNENGMFRTKNIVDMKAEEVFLGDIYGLWTFNIPKWEEKKDEAFGFNDYGLPEKTTIYELVMAQYRQRLVKSVDTIKEDASKKYREIKDGLT